MKPPGIKTRKKLVLFTVAHSLSGAIFGLNLSLFNMIRASVLEGLSVNNYIKNPIMVNLFFSIGGILACLLAGPLIRHYPRRLLNLSLAIASILFTLLQLIPWTSVINIFRLLIGFVSIFYTFLSPVCFKEYLPQGVSAQFSSFFYVGVCLGICFSFGVGHSVDNVAIAKFLITFPVYLELMRLFILLRWFHCESPRFVSIQLFKSNPKKIAFLQKSFNSQFSKKNTALEFPNDTFNLREGDEDILQEDLIEDSIQSVNIDFYISDREPILDNPKHSLKLFIQSNEQIQNYLHTFYSEEDGKIAFNFFFNEFIKVFHRELLPLKVFSWSILRLLIHRNYRLQIFVLVLLNFLNQMTGVNCLIFYSVNLFTGVGLSSELVILNLLVGVFNLLGGLMVPFLINRVGRRGLIYLGLGMQTLVLLLLQLFTIHYQLYLALFSVYLYMMAFAISLGGTLYVYQAEIIPPELIPLVSLVQWLLSFVISSYDMTNMSNTNLFSMAFLFFFISLVGCFIFQGYSVETKNKSNSKILNDWEKRTFMI